MLGAIIEVLRLILNIYYWVVIASVVVSLLISFNVINTYHPFVRTIASALFALTEPVFRQIRRVLPSFGGLDLSPLVVLIAIYFLDRLLIRLLLQTYVP